MKISNRYNYIEEDKVKLLEMLNYFYKSKFDSIYIHNHLINFQKDWNVLQWDITAFCIMYLLEEIQILMNYKLNQGYDGGKLLSSYVTGTRLGIGNPVEFLYKRFIENKDNV